MSAALQMSKPFIPPFPARADKPRGALSMILTLMRNPIEIWGKADFERPFSIGRSVLGLRAAAHDPAAVRRVLLDNAANYRKDDAAASDPAPGPRQRAADRRGRGLAPAAPRARALVFAAPGRRIRSRHAKGRRGGGRAPRPPARRGGDGSRRADVADGARSAGADAVLAGARAGAERIPARGDPAISTPSAESIRSISSARPPSCRGSDACAAVRRSRFFDQAVDAIIESRRALLDRRRRAAARSSDPAARRRRIPETGRGMPEADMRANIVTFINAGHETTANALTWTLYLLSQSPEWRERAEAEADAAFDPQASGLARGMRESCAPSSRKRCAFIRRRRC